VYGLSKKGEKFLRDRGFTFGESWNTYNGDCTLSQTLQGTNLHTQETESDFEFPPYVLLQVHGGADVRGGYTDAKLFKYKGESIINPCPLVFGDIRKKNGTDAERGDVVSIDTSDNGVRLQDGAMSVKIEKGDTIALFLCDSTL